jgi:predicted house-cleaning noncanonical NTP pyrophosphatase (MazG superfamily)
VSERKLVRDRIPELMRDAGIKPQFVRAAEADLTPRLLDKLLEEAEEVRAEPCVEELADVLQVLHSLATRLGVPWERVESVMLEKAGTRGGFDQGWLLELPQASRPM